MHLFRRLVPLLVLGSALGGCLDLELPNLPPDGGVGPTLTIHSPQPGDTIPLDAPVSLDADSVNGVASVTVTCGATPSTGVFTWNVPPYTGVIDFTRCTLVASGIADGGVGQLQLNFIGVDALGHTSTQSFQVFLDTSTATLTVASARPGGARRAAAADRGQQPTPAAAAHRATGLARGGRHRAAG